MNKPTKHKTSAFLFCLAFLTSSSHSTIFAVKCGAPLLLQLARQVQTRGFLSEDDEKDIKYFFAAHGRSPNISFEGGNTLLHYAVMLEDNPKDLLVDAEFSPQQELIRYLLFDLDAEPNVLNHQKQTPLHLALARKNEPLIQLLLKHKDIRLDIADCEGLTPLHLAAMTDNLGAIEFLLCKGVPLTHDRYNRSPLFYAVQNQNPKTTPLLLSKNTVANLLLTFHQLDELQLIDTLRFYASQIQPIIKRQEEEHHETLLHHAVAARDPSVCVFLMKTGANQHSESRYGESPFYSALKTESDPIIRALKGDTNLNELVYRGEPVLHHFARERYYKTLQILIDLGADPLVKDREGKSVIYYALVNHEEVLLRILNQHQEIDYDTVNGVPLRYFFIKTGNRRVVRLLHTMGASFARNDTHNQSALYCMVESRQWGILADTLELKIPKTPHSGIEILNAAREAGVADTLTTLIDCKMDIRACDEHGRNLLFKAVEDEDETGVETLLHLGVDPVIVDLDGNTLLHFAAYHNKRTSNIATRLVTICLENFGTVDIKNHIGQSPLHVAAMIGNTLIASYLLENRANITLKDYLQKTPLTYAYEQKNIALAQIFIRAWLHRIVKKESTAREFSTEVLESSRALARKRNHIDEDLPFITTMNDFFTTCIEEDIGRGSITEALRQEYTEAIHTTLMRLCQST